MLKAFLLVVASLYSRIEHPNIYGTRTTTQKRMAHRSYFVTGANNGVGLEATRMLALHFSEDHCFEGDDKNDEYFNTTIYLLCRSEAKAQTAIQDIASSLEILGTNFNNVNLRFMRFDAYDDEQTICKNIELALQGQPDPLTIGGILLNAGGFGEKQSSNQRRTNETTNEACGIAKLNLIGHVYLVKHLLSCCKQDASTRIVAVGSEAAFCTPGTDFDNADFAAHLTGNVPAKDKLMGTDYAWTKGIIALYWAAYARHNPQLFVLVVSPGAIPSTKLLDQGRVSGALKAIARLSQCFGGSHTVRDGAQRCLWALLGTGPFDSSEATVSSGSFWASTKGFVKEFGNVANLPKGKFVADKVLQDKAWAAVQTIVGEES